MITGMAGVFLFNMTMPLCLKQMHRQFPQHAGFAFGFLTFALFLGFVPVILGIHGSNESADTDLDRAVLAGSAPGFSLGT